MDETSQKYAPAWERYLDHGNLARAARETGVNKDSLYSYARSHAWAEDRGVILAERAALLRHVDASSAKLVTAFFDRPSAQKARMARLGIDLAEAVGTPGVKELDGFSGYDGDKDAYRELLVACIQGARKANRWKEVAELMGQLAALDGHIGVEEKGGDEVPQPDFRSLGNLGRADHAG